MLALGLEQKKILIESTFSWISSWYPAIIGLNRIGISIGKSVVKHFQRWSKTVCPSPCLCSGHDITVEEWDCKDNASLLRDIHIVFALLNANLGLLLN